MDLSRRQASNGAQGVLATAREENEWLRQRVDVLERLNRDLKNRLFETSTHASASTDLPFDLTRESATMPAVSLMDPKSSKNDDSPVNLPEVESLPSDFMFTGRLETGVDAPCVVSSFSPTGDLFAAGDLHGIVHVWRLPFEVERQIGSSFKVTDTPVAWVEWRNKDPNSLFTAGVSDPAASLWDLESGASLGNIGEDLDITAMAVDSNDILHIASGFTNPVLSSFDMRVSHTDAVSCLNLASPATVVSAFGEDGKSVVIGDLDGNVSVLQPSYGNTHPISSFEVSPGSAIASIDLHEASKGSVLAAINSQDNSLRIFDIDPKALQSPPVLVHRFRKHKCSGWPVACAFSKFTIRQRASSIHLDDDEDSGSMRRTRSFVQNLAKGGEDVNSTSSLLLATGSTDGRVHMLRLDEETGSVLNVDTLEGDSSAALSVAFHPSQALLSVGSFNSTVKLWSFNQE